MNRANSTLPDNSKFDTAKSLRGKLLAWLGLNAAPHVKVYRGYGWHDQLQLYGHVLTLSPVTSRRYSGNILRNMWSLVRLFMVRPKPHAAVRLVWQGIQVEAVTAPDGFFHFEWASPEPVPPGWHLVEVAHTENGQVLATGTGELYVPHRTQYGCISDIDDTFLISHSSRLLKRLYVLFTHNARSRRPFDGVARHYRILGASGTTAEMPNPFFYVSSSEWNLYDYLLEFSGANAMPEGVYLLNQLKRLRELLKTGHTKHQGKFVRISRILESYPHVRFVLLGDDTQQDPYIYRSIVEHFPRNIICVYLRRVHEAHAAMVEAVVQDIERMGVPCCYFKHSEEAIAHSQSIGLAQGLNRD